MSRNTCKILLALSIVLLVLMTFVAPVESYHSVPGFSPFLSVVTGMVFLTASAMFISYMNRSIFIVSSDRLTLPFIYVLTSLSNGGALYFSKYHIVAVLTLAAIFFMLRFLVTEELSKSDYFVWCLLISCSSLIVPQMLWLLIPGLVSCMKNTRNNRFRMILITSGAILIPLVYVSAYQYLFTDEFRFSYLLNRLSESVMFCSPKVFSMVQIFHFLVMGVAFLSTLISVLLRDEQIRNTSLRKQSRFIFPYLIFVTVIMLTFVREDDGPRIMIFAVPWSLLFLYFGELTSYGKGWRHLILLTMLSTVILRVYEII